jgi:GNAT superfamily N-acetyltransferase
VERDEIRRLDRLAANATAVSTIVREGGWELRAADRMPFRRTNSVLALDPVTDLDAAIGAAEAFYGARGLPTRFQVSPAVSPVHLDAELADRGYEVEAPVVIGAARTTTVLARTAGARAASLGPLDGDWVAEYAAVHADDDAAHRRVRAYGDMLRALPLGTVGALVRGRDDAPVGLGFAVAEDGWAGLYGMGTRPADRRAGVATAVLHALARWAEAEGAARLYLQVEVDNPGARALYARAGFADAYGYHYRTRRTDLRGR